MAVRGLFAFCCEKIYFGSVLALSVCFADTSPKVGGLGKEVNFVPASHNKSAFGNGFQRRFVFCYSE